MHNWIRIYFEMPCICKTFICDVSSEDILLDCLFHIQETNKEEFGFRYRINKETIIIVGKKGIYLDPNKSLNYYQIQSGETLLIY